MRQPFTITEAGYQISSAIHFAPKAVLANLGSKDMFVREEARDALTKLITDKMQHWEITVPEREHHSDPGPNARPLDTPES